MTQTISVINQKGGVAKTTTVLNLGAALGLLGKKVLLVDLDYQNTLSFGCGQDLDLNEPGVYEFMFDTSLHLENVVRPNVTENVDLLPSNESLAAADMQLFNEMARERILSDRLAMYIGDYDFVLIDNTPSLNLLVINALVASDYYLVPVTPSPWAIRGMSQLNDTVEQVKRKLNPALQMIGIVINRYSKQHGNARDTIEYLENVYPNKVFKERIKETNRFEKAALGRTTVTNFTGTGDLAIAYKNLAQEVIDRAG